tara:strand:+ start:173 stop:511 length:339 start_codon:yes stop_codon:yes gene_type:complete
MNKKEINNLINEGYLIKVCLKSNKKYDKMILKTYLKKQDENIVYPIYYNHIKNLLNKNQINFIDIYNKVKLLRFSDLVNLNIKSKNFTLNKEEISLLTMYKSIKKMEYLEQD